MLFQQLNRNDAEKVFIITRNTSGVTISANAPVYFETDAVSNGNAVSQAQGGLSGWALFAGITDAAVTNSSFGLVQVYGFRQSAYVSAASAGCAIGIPLLPVAGQNYLTDSTSASVNGFKHVTLMETIAAGAANSGVLQWQVFIRAL